jgi:hypothetical protein
LQRDLPRPGSPDTASARVAQQLEERGQLQVALAGGAKYIT